MSDTEDVYDANTEDEGDTAEKHQRQAFGLTKREWLNAVHIIFEENYPKTIPKPHKAKASKPPPANVNTKYFGTTELYYKDAGKAAEQKEAPLQITHFQPRVPAIDSVFVFVDVYRGPSKIPGAQDGLFALVPIDAGTIIGVYNGRIVKDSDDRRGNASSVRNDRYDTSRAMSFYNDPIRNSETFKASVNPDASNYMQLINEPPPGASANCTSIEPPDAAKLLQKNKIAMPKRRINWDDLAEASCKHGKILQTERSPRWYGVVECRRSRFERSRHTWSGGPGGGSGQSPSNFRRSQGAKPGV
jgi:hypothetical protein